jgi:DNA gyrase inhibitor GyrI
MNDNLEVRIVTLERLHVASALGFGAEPEFKAHETLMAWVRAHRLLEGPTVPRFFGFNNPSPSAGSPEYGYELWVTVPPGVTAEAPVQIKDFPGGLYAVARCKGVQNILATWQRLGTWVERSPHRPAQHQWLEEHVRFIDTPLEEYELDLYHPVSSSATHHVRTTNSPLPSGESTM